MKASKEGSFAVFLTALRSVRSLEGDETLKNPENTGENALEPVVGIEPTTYGLRNRCSATELHRRCAKRGTERVKYGASVVAASRKLALGVFFAGPGSAPDEFLPGEVTGVATRRRPRILSNRNDVRFPFFSASPNRPKNTLV